MKKITKIEEVRGLITTEPLILLCYWFVSNKYNDQVFRDLQCMLKNLGEESVRIVCLNPFNSDEEIMHYRHIHNYSFEMSRDRKNTGMFYQVNTYPTFILMNKKGKILHRQNGWEDDCLQSTEEMIRKGIGILCPEPVHISEVFVRTGYKKNLSLQWLNG